MCLGWFDTISFSKAIRFFNEALDLLVNNLIWGVVFNGDLLNIFKFRVENCFREEYKFDTIY